MARRISENPNFSPPPRNSSDAEYLLRLHREVTRWARDVGRQINELAEGQVHANYNSLSATPSLSITRQVGDIIRDNSPTEDGTAGAKYVRLGWLTVTDGTASAASVVEIRALTGN